ncbi:MAG: hypothetical protein Q7S21_06860 [archaeon]|nr:hypothetical protein [archaeon]
MRKPRQIVKPKSPKKARLQIDRDYKRNKIARYYTIIENFRKEFEEHKIGMMPMFKRIIKECQAKKLSPATILRNVGKAANSSAELKRWNNDKAIAFRLFVEALYEKEIIE